MKEKEYKEYVALRRDAPYFNQYGKILKEPLNLPISNIVNSIAICYIRGKRGSEEYKKLCPTKNIRWHFSDPRQSEEKVKEQFESFIVNFNNFVNDLVQNSDLSSEMIIKLYNFYFKSYEKPKLKRYVLSLTQIFENNFCEILIKFRIDSLIIKQTKKMGSTFQEFFKNTISLAVANLMERKNKSLIEIENQEFVSAVHEYIEIFLSYFLGVIESEGSHENDKIKEFIEFYSETIYR